MMQGWRLSDFPAQSAAGLTPSNTHWPCCMFVQVVLMLTRGYPAPPRQSHSTNADCQAWLKGTPLLLRHLTQATVWSIWPAKELEAQGATQNTGYQAGGEHSSALGARPFYFIGSMRLAQVKARSQPGPSACGLQFLVYKEGGFITRSTKGFVQDKVF